MTVHPRPDQRHIRPQDCYDIGDLVKSLANIEFNIEGNPFATSDGSYPGFMQLVEETLPDQCTLVPDSSEQLTSDHGFDLRHSGASLEPIIKRLRELGIRVSLFMDPIPEQVKLAKEVGADRIELYTGPYAEAYAACTQKGSDSDLDNLYEKYRVAAHTAIELDLGVNAGHDLNRENLQLFRTLPGLQEVSIGHALTIDSLLMGMSEAVSSYLSLLRQDA